MRKIYNRFNPHWEPKEVFKKRYDLNQLQKYEHILNCNGKSIKQFKSVLEFGCGYGRLLEHMSNIIGDNSLHGCDVAEEWIKKLQKRFPKVDFLCNGTKPPLNYKDNQFDLIYSYSVFTHLSEQNHIAWLQELERLLKPGGVMLHSVKSYEFVRRANIFSPYNLLKYQLNEPFNDFETNHPYHYIVDNPRRLEYGLSIISKKYIESKWPEYTGLEIIDYSEGCIEAYPEGCHDLVLLYKD